MSTQRLFANAGPREGFWRVQDGAIVIGVHGDSSHHWIPIGVAFGAGTIEDDRGPIQAWRLTVNKVDLPGRWVLLDREFLPVEVVYSDVRGYGDRADCQRAIGTPESLTTRSAGHGR